MCGPRACIRICAVYRERNGRCRADRLDWLSHGAELGKAAKTLATDRAFESLHSCRPRIVSSSEAQAPATAAAWTWPNLRSGLGPEPSFSRWSKRILSYRRPKRRLAGYASQCPNCELLHLGPLGGRSVSITAGRVAGRSQFGVLNRELVRPNFSAIHRDTELGKGELVPSCIS